MENDIVDEIGHNVVIVNDVPHYTLEYIAVLQAALKNAKVAIRDLNDQILYLSHVNEQLADDLESLEREIQRRAEAATY
jgi:hypothetical protein